MIIFENLLTEVKIKNFFISQKSYVSFSIYLSFGILNDPMIYLICDFMISINKYMRETVFLNIAFEPQLVKSLNLARW